MYKENHRPWASVKGKHGHSDAYVQSLPSAQVSIRVFSALFAQAATPGAQVDIKRHPRENQAPSSAAAWDAGILPAQPEVMIMLRKEMGGQADPYTVSPFVRPPIPCPGRGMEGVIWDGG